MLLPLHMEELEGVKTCALSAAVPGPRMYRVSMSSPERKAALILAAIGATEGTWLILNVRASPARFLQYTGFTADANAGPLGWALALAAFIIFIAYSAARLPSVRANLVSFSVLKVLAMVV